MSKIHSVLEVQSSGFILENMVFNAIFEAAQRDKDPIKYLNIINNLWCNNKSEQRLMKYLFQETKQVHNLTQKNNKSTIEYFKRFNNSQKALESCEGILTQ